jgi:2-polyprenyl-6-methoxyphenol hydroxylase-like FAD-dependent oxidoreductase
MKAVIIGGGIAGLATAIALKREKTSCVVYERAPELREVGAGLAIWANGVNALRHLGVKAEVMAAASVVDEAITMDHGGNVLARTDIGALARRHGAECICVPRGELQRILYEAAGPEWIHTGADFVRIEERREQVTVYFDNGPSAAADFVVAADGMRSTVRKQLHPDSQPRFAGYLAWRGMARGAFDGLPLRTTILVLGRGCQAGIFPCGSNRVYWFATQNRGSNPKQSPEGRKLAVAKALHGWSAPFPELIDATAPDSILENDILDLEPLDAWVRDGLPLQAIRFTG